MAKERPYVFVQSEIIFVENMRFYCIEQLNELLQGEHAYIGSTLIKN